MVRLCRDGPMGKALGRWKTETPMLGYFSSEFRGKARARLSSQMAVAMRGPTAMASPMERERSRDRMAPGM